MKILVTVASKHGSTGEMGEIIAGVLRDAGAQVVTSAPEAAADVGGYDAVVIGSAVYAGRWLGPARDFVDRHRAELAERPVWVFSSGPIGDPPMPVGDAPDGPAIAEQIGARAHRTFAGRLDRRRLGLLERTVTTALHAPDGDFRDLEAVRRWADGIAAALLASATRA